MTPTFISVTSQDDVAKLRTTTPALRVIAIDLGFSSARASCGYADSVDCPEGTQLQFCEVVARAWEANRAAELVLILEAPLSGAFLHGNPTHRGDFERAPAAGGNCHWNGPGGAATSLMAIYFLLELNRSGLQHSVHLIEGFVSRANKPPASKGRQHAADAALLLATFVQPEKASCTTISPRTQDVIISVSTNILGLTKDASAPIVLVPKPTHP